MQRRRGIFTPHHGCEEESQLSYLLIIEEAKVVVGCVLCLVCDTEKLMTAIGIKKICPQLTSIPRGRVSSQILTLLEAKTGINYHGCRYEENKNKAM